MTFDASQVYQPAEDTFLLIRSATAEVHADDVVIESIAIDEKGGDYSYVEKIAEN